MPRPSGNGCTAASRPAIGVLLAILVLTATWGSAPAAGKPARDEPFPLRKREVETLSKVADFERMLERHGHVHTDASLRDYVEGVGRRLVPADFADDRLRFRFHVMRSPEPNAFALPNGSIYVTLGLLSLLENEAQLASVLAHEVTHAARYHYFRFDRQYRAKSMAMNLFSVGFLAVGGWGGLLASLGAEALYVGTIFGYSRDLEEEADRIGLSSLDAAGYDVAQAPASFRRLLVDYEGMHVDSPIFYSSHPRLRARIESTEEQIRKEGLAPDAARAFPDRYALAREQAAREEVRLAIAGDLPRTAIATADYLIERRPDSAEAHYLLAEAYRALGYRERDISSEPIEDIEKKRLMREKRHSTPEEIEKQLAESEEGRAAWAANAASAEAAYRKALALDPRNAESHLGLALLCDKMGRTREALEAVEASLRLAPGGTLQRARALRLQEDLGRRLAREPEGVTP
jgi:predicted Zn-dependent protease